MFLISTLSSITSLSTTYRPPSDATSNTIILSDVDQRWTATRRVDTHRHSTDDGRFDAFISPSLPRQRKYATSLGARNLKTRTKVCGPLTPRPFVRRTPRRHRVLRTMTLCRTPSQTHTLDGTPRPTRRLHLPRRQPDSLTQTHKIVHGQPSQPRYRWECGYHSHKLKRSHRCPTTVCHYHVRAYKDPTTQVIGIHPRQRHGKVREPRIDPTVSADAYPQLRSQRNEVTSRNAASYRVAS